MVPTPLRLTHSSRLLVLLYSLASRYVSNYFNPNDNILLKRAEKEKHDTKFIVFACLIPVLVLLSGVFAGLTLGYMSLDETQLNVLSISGTPSVPLRPNSHSH
jgi:metal transporter CNNM